MKEHGTYIKDQIQRNMYQSHRQQINWVQFQYELANFGVLFGKERKKKFLLVDRENIGQYDFPNRYIEEYYVLEVVNKDHRKLPKNKFIVAKNTCDNAADHLLMILTYEISKIKPKKIIIVSNDNFAQTFAKIMAQFETRVEIKKIAQDNMKNNAQKWKDRWKDY